MSCVSQNTHCSDVLELRSQVRGKRRHPEAIETYDCSMSTNSLHRSYSRKSAGVLLLVGVLAGVTVGGGVGVIAASSTKTVTVCANKKTNVLRYAKNGKCAKTETKVVLNQMGNDGATGAAGLNGTNGANTNSQVKNLCGANGTTACAVGLQGPGGGIVFITPSTLGNTSGLFYEAAPATWSSQLGDSLSAWCNFDDAVLGVASTVIGIGAMDGAARTTEMLGVCTSGAANLVDAYTVAVNGVVYGDWFLPSRGEVNQMYVNRVALGASCQSYWSSTEQSAEQAWGMYFTPYSIFEVGVSMPYGKLSRGCVRPVRAF